ncbi:MAG: 50S ribosomal protein L19 [Bdellovibrionales bacterium]|nr:50S ribosomal protein L19 [Bdellovibrionales bacterium]
MSNLILEVTKAKHKFIDVPTFKTGDTVEVFVKVKEGEKERIQKYRGLVTKIQGADMSKSFTVRKMSGGVGVERTFPFASPAIDKIELISEGVVRRSRLFYLRDLIGKKARIESTLVSEDSPKAAAKKADTAEVVKQ